MEADVDTSRDDGTRTMWLWIGIVLVVAWALLYFAFGLIECFVHIVVFVGALLVVFGVARKLGTRGRETQ